MHEASLHPDNAFITLTYADEHLPEIASLDRQAFPKFMKRLRRRLPSETVRYFHCGEYGEITGRPHYHACLFGYDFADKYQWSIRRDHPVFRSDTLEALWPYGQSEIGSVTFESAAYVARYILKKVTGRDSAQHYEVANEVTGEILEREREYTTMSRRPGIGKPWLDKFGSEVYPSDEVIVRGKRMKPPRYYDTLHEIWAPKEAREVSQRRRRNRHPEDETDERLQVREVCTTARLTTFAREMES